MAYAEILRTLCNPCLYNCAIFSNLSYLEAETSSKVCQNLSKVFQNPVEHPQDPGKARIVHSNIFNDIKRY